MPFEPHCVDHGSWWPHSDLCIFEKKWMQSLFGVFVQKQTTVNLISWVYYNNFALKFSSEQNALAVSCFKKSHIKEEQKHEPIYVAG